MADFFTSVKAPLQKTVPLPGKVLQIGTQSKRSVKLAHIARCDVEDLFMEVVARPTTADKKQ